MCRFVVIHQTTAVGFLSELSWTLLYFSFSSSWNCSSSSFSSFSSFSSYFFFSLSFFLSFFFVLFMRPCRKESDFLALWRHLCCVLASDIVCILYVAHLMFVFYGGRFPSSSFPFPRVCRKRQPCFSMAALLFPKKGKKKKLRARSNKIEKQSEDDWLDHPALW